MKRILLMSLLAISTALSAQKPVELELWPDGAPNSNGITTPEQKLENNRISNVSEPTLTVYPAAKPNGLAVVACPGGGYIRLAMNHEGHDMADWFNAQGITYAVLKYRMPNGHHDVPLSDTHQAIRLMREHANEWHIQKWVSWGPLQADIWPVRQPPTIQPERARIFRSCFIPS